MNSAASNRSADAAEVSSPARRWNFWTTSEMRLLQTHYAALGARGCASMLPRHSRGSIAMRASVLGLVYSHGPKAITAERCAELRAFYEDHRGIKLKTLSRRFQISESTINALARRHGWTRRYRERRGPGND